MSVEQTPIMTVALHPSSDWTWDIAVSDQGSGLYDVRLGPSRNGGVEPIVTYRWSVSDGRFVGPDGGVGEEFIRFEEDATEILHAFATASPTSSRR